MRCHLPYNYGQTKVYELITKIEGTNQSTRNALSEVENLISPFIYFMLAKRPVGLVVEHFE